MRVLALDHGTARCGAAICDPSGTIVRPLEVIAPPDTSAVARIVADSDVGQVVVGVPVGMSGAEGEQAAIARRFIDELTEALAVPVVGYDERLTTRLAQQTRRDTGSRAAEDSLAAAHLLESYLAASS
ncbi:MAG: Holliday junction resolvase RuvX [Solirubrobacterales bacterium]